MVGAYNSEPQIYEDENDMGHWKWTQMKPFNILNFCEDYQLKFIKKHGGKNQEPAEMPENIHTDQYTFKDESNLKLSNHYWMGLFVKGKSKRTGFGRQVDKFNNIYEGMVKDDLKHGYGRILLQDGSHMEGFWSKDNLHGLVARYDIDGK